MIDLKTFAEDVYLESKSRGWWDQEEADNPVTKMFLIVGEVVEAMEEYRAGYELTQVYYGVDGKPEGVPIELADTVIRILDFCEHYSIDLESALIEKREFNLTRSYRHGGKRF